MKYTGAIILAAIAVVGFFVVVAADVSFFNALPPMVKFSIPVPQAYNATEFDYQLSYDGFSVHFDSYGYRDPTEHYPCSSVNTTFTGKTFTGNGRVGEEITVKIFYYGYNQTTDDVFGLNTVTHGTPVLVGSKTYDLIIREVDDNVIGQYDWGFYVWLGFAVVWVVFFGFCAGVSAAVQRADDEEEEKQK